MSRDQSQVAQDSATLQQLLSVKERRRDRAHRELVEVKERQRHAQLQYDQQEGELSAMLAHHAGRIAELRATISRQPATGASHVALRSQEDLFRQEQGRKEEQVRAAAAALNHAQEATATASAAFLEQVRAVEKVKELRRATCGRKAS